MSVSPPSGSASAVRMQLRTLCLSAGLRLSDCAEPAANHLGRPWTINLCPQRPTNATSFRGSIQAIPARVQIDPTTRFGLCRINHADPATGDDPQQVGLVLALSASRAHADRTCHAAQASRTSLPHVSHRERNRASRSPLTRLRFAPEVQRRSGLAALRVAFRTRSATASRLSRFPGCVSHRQCNNVAPGRCPQICLQRVVLPPVVRPRSANGLTCT
jgi:hypothetical protein